MLVATSTMPAILSAMNNVPRQTLRELIDKYGPDLCSNAGRCGGLLRDLCGAHRREINILIGALKERVPLDLLAARSAMPRALLLSQLAKRLEDQLAFTEEAARWAVDSWALALGVVTDADVEKRERERAESARPSTTTTPRPSPEVDSEQRKSEARANVPPPPPAIPHPQPRPYAPPRAQPPTISRPPQPATAFPPLTGGTNIARQRNPAGQTPTSRQQPATNAPQRHGTSADPTPKKSRSKLRGCFVGCFLIVLLSALLLIVSPYVISVLREEQQPTNSTPPPP